MIVRDHLPPVPQRSGRAVRRHRRPAQRPALRPRREPARGGHPPRPTQRRPGRPDQRPDRHGRRPAARAHQRTGRGRGRHRLLQRQLHHGLRARETKRCLRRRRRSGVGTRFRPRRRREWPRSSCGPSCRHGSLADLDRDGYVEPFLTALTQTLNRKRDGLPSPADRARRVPAVSSFLADIAEWGWPDAPTRRLVFNPDIPRITGLAPPARHVVEGD